MTKEQSEMDEFFQLVGSEKLPEYHFYYMYNGELRMIRLNDHSPKPDSMPWPVVWENSRGSKRFISKITEEVKKGEATYQGHHDESGWLD